MKTQRLVWVDGFYRTEKEARKLYPDGYDKTFTKTVQVQTKAEIILRLILYILGMGMLLCITLVFIMFMFAYMRSTYGVF